MFLLPGVLIVYFISSQECRKSQNFASMSAIVAALQSIPQLILTRETKLTKSEKRLLSQLDEVLAPQGDHRAYREALQNGESPFVVPWLGAYSPFPGSFLHRNTNTMHYPKISRVWGILPNSGPLTHTANLLRPHQPHGRSRPTPTNQLQSLRQTPRTRRRHSAI